MRVKRKAGGRKQGEGSEGSGSNGGKNNEGKQSATVAEELEFVRAFMSFSEDERQLIGHNFTASIKSCSFRGRTCTDETLVLSH